MQSLSLSHSLALSSSAHSFSPFLSHHRIGTVRTSELSRFAPLSSSSSSSTYVPLRFSGNYENKTVSLRRLGTVCHAGPLSPSTLIWISAISSVVLMLAEGTAAQKSFLVPLFALQAPTGVISWIKGDYGLWSAFIALLVRLFSSIPCELELPFTALLLVIVAPSPIMNLRGTREGCIICLAIAAYLAFQQFSRSGSLEESFDQGSIVASLAIICILVVSCLLLI